MDLPGRAAALFVLLVGSAVGSGIACAQQVLTRESLSQADYVVGRRAFQMRCSACHTLAEGGSHLTGPNLWGVMGKPAGTRDGFGYSDALLAADISWTPDRLDRFLADPATDVPGNRMAVPEGVPNPDRLALIAFMMLETGGADWPKPELPKAVVDPDRSKPVAERFPSFWNHMMSNTTRYRMVTADGELVFKAYFNRDGSITSDRKSIRGFWRPDERDFFCYALYGIPLQPGQLVECFPMVAMSIPRFAEQLWESKPAEGVQLYGGILPGRP
ncbi:MAG: c-type cytochrome [Gammaproteobacteria bacterium]|nr:c-type cytochrome [Gammaproteobacteria bacterium]